jgi:hypothetical protein
MTSHHRFYVALMVLRGGVTNDTALVGHVEGNALQCGSGLEGMPVGGWELTTGPGWKFGVGVAAGLITGRHVLGTDG